MRSGQYSVAFAYKNLTIDAINWTPIVALCDCDYASLFNPSGGWFGFGASTVMLRSSQYDATTEKPVAPGMQESFTSVHSRWSGTGPRFEAGTPIWYAQAVSGSVDVILTCVL